MKLYTSKENESGQIAMQKTFYDYLVVNNATIAMDSKRDRLLCEDGVVRPIFRKAIPNKKRVYWCFD
jgi:hypothetical protein